jgi:phage-related protein
MCIQFLTVDRQIHVMKSSERHFFHYTERTYHFIILHIFKKKTKKNKA